MKTYVFIDIDDIHYNNRVGQINPDLYEQYYNVLNYTNKTKAKILFLRFSSMYNKENYEIPLIFKTINKFAEDVSGIKNLKYINIHVNYRNLLFVLLLSKAVKKINKNIIMILSGKYLRSMYENIITNIEWIDYIDLLLEKDSCLKNYNAIENKEENDVISLISRNKIDLKNNICCNLKSIKLKTEDEIKYEAKVLNNALILKNSANIKIGEGCVFNCNYCTFRNLYFNKYVQLEPSHIINTMNLYNEIYGTTTFLLEHELFIKNQNKLLKFCEELIKLNGKFKWICSTRVEYLNKKNISLLAKAGCKSIFIGIETGSEKIQKYMNKNINLEKLLSTIEEISKSGINVIFSFIYKYPEETEKDLLETFKLMYDIKEIEFRNKKSIFFYELSKIKFFPKTQITKNYYSRLKFDNYRNSEISEYPSDIVKFIDDNKEILTDFFNLRKNIKKEYEKFEDFFIYLFNNYIYINYDQVKKILFKYNFNILKIYNIIFSDYRSKLYELLNLESKNKIENNNIKYSICNYLFKELLQ